MIDNANFLVAPLVLALFGLPAAFARGSREQPAVVRASLAFLSGTVAFAVWCTLLSAIGVSWSAWTVMLPLAGCSLVAAEVMSGRADERNGVQQGVPVGWDVLAIVIGAGCFAHLALRALTSRSTSIDFFFFWGVKAIEFAEARGIDAEYLAWPFNVHAHVPYPPLVPLVNAWGIELAGRLPWRAALVSMAVWVLLAYPIVLRSMRSRLPAGEATMAAGVWLSGISIAVAASYSAGNAEAPLVFFATSAVAALLAREGTFPGWVPPVALSGLVLTKSEGAVFWILIVAGVAIRGVLERRKPKELARALSGMLVLPPLALAPWVAFLVRNDLPLKDAAREALGSVSVSNLGPAVVEMARNLEAGSGWLAWGVAVLVFLLSWRGWRETLPALTLVAGTLTFLLVYYLHYQGDDIGAWVRWTMPRVSLPALSAVLMAAPVASGWEREGGRESRSRSW